MQSVTFDVPVLTETYEVRLGGLLDEPFINRKPFVPFQERDFEMVQKTFTLEANETLQTFWGVNNNFPLPPTLNFSGRGGGLITTVDLPFIHAELTAIYGYPGWLSVTIKDFLLYDMQQKNNEFLHTTIASLSDIENKLQTFAQQAKKTKVKKIAFQLNTTYERQKEQLVEYIEDNGNKKTIDAEPLASHIKTENFLSNLIEVPLDYELDYNKYIRFKVIGGIDTTHIDATHNNNYSLICLGLRSPTTVYASSYRLLTYGTAPITGQNVTITLFFESAKEIVFFPKLKKSKTKIKKEPQALPETENNTENTKKPETLREHWLFLFLVIVVFLMIILQKVSSK
jgi:hypothetical protein